jgi:predicted dehydrogenase
MTYRAAIIGCGKIASEFADDPRIKDIFTHAGAYTACRDTDLVAVCDADGDKAKRCGTRWNVPETFQDVDEMMVKVKPEIVSISTPDPTHYPVICDVMKYDCVRAIYAEKPLALSCNDAKEILDYVRSRNIILAVNYFRRYAPSLQQLRTEIVHERCIGEIQEINCIYTKGILHNGTHLIDLARFLAGNIESVRGFYNRRSDLNADDPSLDAHLQFSNGAAGFIQGHDEDMFDICEMDIIGSAGRIRILDSGHTLEYYEVRDDPYYSGYMGLALKNRDTRGMKDTLLHGVEDLVACIGSGRSPFCSGDDGYAALEIGLAIRASARTGNLIAIQNRVV